MNGPDHPAETDAKHCPMCGAQVTADQRECLACGEFLPAVNRESESSPEFNGWDVVVALASVVGGLMLTGGIISGLLFMMLPSQSGARFASVFMIVGPVSGVLWLLAGHWYWQKQWSQFTVAMILGGLGLISLVVTGLS